MYNEPMRTYAVETRGQGAVILGGPVGLTAAITQELLLLGVSAITPDSIKQIETLRETHDLDYLIIFSGANKPSYLSSLQSFLQSGEARLITVNHLNTSADALGLTPVSCQLIFSDYVGAGELSSPILESWLKSAKEDHHLVITGDGLGEVSLLSQADLARILALAIVQPSSSPGEPVFLGNPEPISHLSLAYLIRSSLPYKLSIKFDQAGEGESWVYDGKLYADNLTKLDYRISSSAQDELKKYLSSKLKSYLVPPAPTRSDPKVDPTPPVSPPQKLTPLKPSTPVFIPIAIPTKKLKLPKLRLPWPRPRSIIGRGLFIAPALYLGTLAFSVTITLMSLRTTVTRLRAGDLPESSPLSRFTATYLRANWVAATSIPGVAKQTPVKEATLLLDTYLQALAVLDTSKELNTTTTDLTHYIFGSGNADIARSLSLSRLQAEELYQQLSLLDGSLPATTPQIIPARYRDDYPQLKSKLSSLKKSVITSKAILASAPDIIGLGGRRKYAVLFQNNMELRATGGFIGSFSILSFENGKLYDMPLYDVYDADGQLKGHVEPPAPIKNILGEANWYLRDSNFDPDFPTSARRAEWFIKKSLNQDLDGTIAVNVGTLTALLRATGPIQVSDYNETITADNLYERSQFHAEVNFFPGSTQKKEFLSTVASALFAKLPGLGEGEGLKIIAALAQTVDEKNTLVSLTNPTSDHIFASLGWNGQLSDFPCPTSGTCHKNYAMVVDSNFGVNKANYFVKRSIEEVITFDKNLSVNHVMRLNYHNTSTSTAWPAGVYKNYQRLYLPVGANIVSVKIEDKLLDPKDYAITSEHGKFVVAYLVQVPINDKAQVVVEYSTPQLPQDKDLLYTWYWQKQSGTSSSDPITVYLNYPLYLKPAVISPEADLAPQQLKFNFTNDTDHRVTVKFTK